MLPIHPETGLLPAFVSPYVLLLIAVAVVGAFLAVTMVVVIARWAAARLRSMEPHEIVEAVSEKLSSTSGQEDEAASEGDLVSAGRRRFLTAISVAFGGVGAAIVGVPVIGVLFSPVRKDNPEVWRPVGAVDDFGIGETILVTILDPDAEPWAGIAAQRGVWLRRVREREFTAFSGYCTHVGCPVRWEATARLFMCPCHGGAFDEDGSVAAGPPPEPLTRYSARVRAGQVEVRTEPVPLPATDGGQF